MADGATWRGQPISLDLFLSGGRVAAACATCGAEQAIDPPRIAQGASLARLEAAIRCTCGGRGGRLRLAAEPPAKADGPRCFLFVV